MSAAQTAATAAGPVGSGPQGAGTPPLAGELLILPTAQGTVDTSFQLRYP